MTDGLLAIILALIAVVSGGIGSFISSWFSRRKTDADAASIITKAAQDLLGDYRKQADELEAENKKLKAEFRAYQQEVNEQLRQYRIEQGLQEKAIDNLQAKYRKLELALIINARQMRSMGIEPLISPGRLESITLDELRDMAESLSNIEERRRKRAAGDD